MSTFDKALTRYSVMSRWIHWLMTFTITIMIGTALSFESLEPQMKSQVLKWHIAFGIISFLLLLARIVIYFTNKGPSFPESMKNYEKMAAKLIHFMMYVLMLFVPLSGYFIFQAQGRAEEMIGVPILNTQLISVDRALGIFMKEAHENLAWAIIALIVLHILAVVNHHYIRKEKTLDRML